MLLPAGSELLVCLFHWNPPPLASIVADNHVKTYVSGSLDTIQCTARIITLYTLISFYKSVLLLIYCQWSHDKDRSHTSDQYGRRIKHKRWTSLRSFFHNLHAFHFKFAFQLFACQNTRYQQSVFSNHQYNLEKRTLSMISPP